MNKEQVRNEIRKELNKLINVSRMLSKETINLKIANIVDKYINDEGGILYHFENGLLVVERIDLLY